MDKEVEEDMIEDMLEQDTIFDMEDMEDIEDLADAEFRGTRIRRHSFDSEDSMNGKYTMGCKTI